MVKGIVETGEYFSQTLKCAIVVTKQVLSIAINRDSKEDSYDRFNAQLISRNHISVNDVATLWDEMREKDPEDLKAIRKNIGKPSQVAHDELQPISTTWVARNASGAKGANLAENISETGEIDKLKVAKAAKTPYKELLSLQDLTGMEYATIPSYAELEAGYADFVAQKAKDEANTELANNSR